MTVEPSFALEKQVIELIAAYEVAKHRFLEKEKQLEHQFEILHEFRS